MQARWTVLSGLLLFGPTAWAASVVVNTTSQSIAEVDTVGSTANLTQQVDTFQVELKARMQGGVFLFDQTYNAALTDPAVQAAIAQAKTMLTNAGAVSFSGPTQLSSNQSTTSSTDSTQTKQNNTPAISAFTYIGPVSISIGNLGTCQSYGGGGIQGGPLLTGCTGGSPSTFNVIAGGQDIDTLVVLMATINTTVTTTNTTLTSQVYELDGIAAGPTPTVASVVNAYNSQSSLSPGVVAFVNGSNFGTVAANVTVMVGGKAAYVFPASVTATQLEIEIPMELAAGPTTLTVTASGASSLPFNTTLVAFAPTCQTQDNSGSGLGSVLTALSKLVTLSAPAHSGDQLVISCTGLGPTNPVTPTGLTAAANPPASKLTLTIGVTPVVATAALTPGTAGVYQVAFTVPAGVQGTQPLVVSIGGASSSTLLTIGLAGLSAVVNNASFANPGIASPGSIATAFANGLGTAIDHLSGLYPSTKSEGVQLTFNNSGAPMFHLVASTAQQQVDLLVPTELPTSGTVNVQLSTSTTTYSNYSLTMVPANPGFYRIPDPKVSTRFNIIAQFANTVWLVLPSSTTTALGLPACTKTTGALTQCGQPAAIGDYLVIYTTGLGLATPNGDANGKPLPTGQTPPVDGSILYRTPTTPVVTVGGVPATVLFSGLAPGFQGLYQIDIQVPPGVTSSDDVPVKVTILGASDTATISVQPRGN